jgi:hypothetical protein
VRGHAHAQARGGGVEEAEHGLPRRNGLSGVGEAGAHAGVEGRADLRLLDLHVDPGDLRPARGHAGLGPGEREPGIVLRRLGRPVAAFGQCVRAGEREPRSLGIRGERRELGLERGALGQEGRDVGAGEHCPRGDKVALVG